MAKFASRTAPLAERQTRRWWGLSILLAMIIGWAYIFFTGQGGWLELQQERRILTDLEAEVLMLEASNDSLRNVLWRMENDSAFVERMAREQYGLVLPGEHLYRLIKRDTTDTISSAND
jgi:cell division protein FtsB